MKIPVKYDSCDYFFIAGVLLIEEFDNLIVDIFQEIDRMWKEQKNEEAEIKTVIFSPEMFRETEFSFEIKDPSIIFKEISDSEKV